MLKIFYHLPIAILPKQFSQETKMQFNGYRYVYNFLAEPLRTNLIPCVVICLFPNISKVKGRNVGSSIAIFSGYFMSGLFLKDQILILQWIPFLWKKKGVMSSCSSFKCTIWESSFVICFRLSWDLLVWFTTSCWLSSSQLSFKYCKQ